MRILFIIEYAGTNYGGFQSQLNAESIQDRLECAINKVTGEGNKITAAGRTDSGVHALGMAAHFDTEKNITPEKLRMAVNAYLPPDIAIVEASEVSGGLHARYSAVSKTYLYKLYVSRTLSPLRRLTHMRVLPPLDIDKMKAAARYLVGEHDFAAFCKAGSSAKTTVRTIYNIDISAADGEIFIKVTGNGFLYNMVRIITGFLINAGKGKYAPEDAAAALGSRSREYTRLVAEPQGLYLLQVEYPPFSGNI